MIEPALSDDAFLADLAEVGRRARMLDLWWLGQSGFLLHHRERWVLVDPYLSESLSTKYAHTDKPHVRMTRPVIDPVRFAEALGAQQLTVTSSHSHTDHLDPGTLRPLVTRGKVLTLVVPRSAEQLAFERSLATASPNRVHVEGIEAGENIGSGVKITAVPAAHDTLERDEHGRSKYLGYVFEFSPYFLGVGGRAYRCEKEWTVYHSGDTVVYDGMVEDLRNIGPIDVAMLPINGKVGNMGGRDAARLAKDIGARLVIPCHYEMFEFNTADPRDEFIPECERIGQPYKVLRAGERLTLGA